MITQQKLKEILNYDPSTGVFTWAITMSSRAMKGMKAGTLRPDSYIDIRIEGRAYKAHRLAWIYINGNMTKHEIDHINHVKNDNRLENLREVTHQENQLNKSMDVRNTSGTTGVYFRKKVKKWEAQLKVKGDRVFLGFFIDKTDAIIARKMAEFSLGFHNNHGEQ